MRYVGNLTVTALRRMGHKSESVEELTALAKKLNVLELRTMKNFIKSWKVRNGKTNEA